MYTPVMRTWFPLLAFDLEKVQVTRSRPFEGCKEAGFKTIHTVGQSAKIMYALSFCAMKAVCRTRSPERLDCRTRKSQDVCVLSGRRFVP